MTFIVMPVCLGGENGYEWFQFLFLYLKDCGLHRRIQNHAKHR